MIWIKVVAVFSWLMGLGMLWNAAQARRNGTKFALIHAVLPLLVLPLLFLIPYLLYLSAELKAEPSHSMIASISQYGWVIGLAAVWYGRKFISWLLPVFIGLCIIYGLGWAMQIMYKQVPMGDGWLFAVFFWPVMSVVIILYDLLKMKQEENKTKKTSIRTSDAPE
ncbi:MAG: hypothetical protein K2Q12_08605 [Rickettsiales bacterium]|nr:hypothetical protein [Rickettsiales bacterium]